MRWHFYPRACRRAPVRGCGEQCGGRGGGACGPVVQISRRLCRLQTALGTVYYFTKNKLRKMSFVLKMQRYIKYKSNESCVLCLSSLLTAARLSCVGQRNKSSLEPQCVVQNAIIKEVLGSDRKYQTFFNESLLLSVRQLYITFLLVYAFSSPGVMPAHVSHKECSECGSERSESSKVCQLLKLIIYCIGIFHRTQEPCQVSIVAYK